MNISVVFEKGSPAFVRRHGLYLLLNAEDFNLNPQAVFYKTDFENFSDELLKNFAQLSLFEIPCVFFECTEEDRAEQFLRTVMQRSSADEIREILEKSDNVFSA